MTMLPASKISTSGRMIHLPMNLGQQLAVLPDQVGFDFQAERQIAAMAGFGDLPQLIDDLRQMFRRDRRLAGG